MTFRQAVDAVGKPALQFHDGLQAFDPVDRRGVTCRNARSLRGSINLDRDLGPGRPNEPVWDYGIGMAKDARNDRVVWVEVHPASSLHIDPVLQKLRWLTDWLRGHGAGLSRLERCFVWVASGAVSIRPGTPQHRRLAQAGLRLVAHLRLD